MTEASTSKFKTKLFQVFSSRKRTDAIDHQDSPLESSFRSVMESAETARSLPIDGVIRLFFFHSTKDLPSRSCPRCLVTRNKPGQATTLIPAWPDYIDSNFISKYASGRCPQCYIFWTALSSIFYDIPVGASVGYTGRLTITIGGSRGKSYHFSLCSAYASEAKSDIGYVEIREPVYECASSSKSLQRIRQIVENCSTKHVKCYISNRTSLPRRVVDISEYYCPFLYEPRQEEQDRYCTLSYCWGADPDFITTTSQNIEKWRKGIPWLKLPRTFQDAICIARELSINYLWIDALCIVQDLPSDWEQESAQMGRIYENAFLTIAATSAASAQGGFLHPRKRSIPLDSALIGAKLSDTHYLEKTHSRSEFRDALQGIAKIESYPLFLRGWTYQERLLSRRVLHFTPLEWVFECRQGRECECGEVEEYEFAGLEIVPFSSSPGQTFREENATKVEAYQQWHDFAHEYSGKKFTFHSDRLPALSGIARKCQNEYLGTYYAGMWENDLPRALIWMAESPNTTERAPTYIAPSWSWMCLFGTTNHELVRHSRRQGGPTYHVCDVLEVCLELDTDSKGDYGRIKGCMIKLKGPLLPVMYQKHGNYLRLFYNEEPVPEFADPNDARLPDGINIQIHFDTSTDAESAIGKELYFFGVAIDAAGSHNGMGLLLIRSSRQAVGAYERIGVIVFMFSAVTPFEATNKFQEDLRNADESEVSIV